MPGDKAYAGWLDALPLRQALSCVDGDWGHLFLLLARYFSSLTYSIGQQPFNSLRVPGAEWEHLVELALGSLRFVDTQMALPHLSPHYLAASGNAEAFLCPFMSLDFRHFKLPF